jgi:hypothetical protein
VFDKKRKRFNAYVNSQRAKLVNTVSDHKNRIKTELKAKQKLYRYKLRLTPFKYKNAVSNFVSSQKEKHGGIYLLTAYALLSAVFIVFTVYQVKSNGYKNVEEYLIVSASMVGGMLAILFTFNTIIINFAIDQYPPEFYRLSGYNRRLDALYFSLAAITLVQFCIGLSFNGETKTNRFVITLLGLILIFIAIYVLFYAFTVVRKRLDPIQGLISIRDNAIKALDRGDKYSKDLQSVENLNPTLDPKEKSMLRYAAYTSLSPSYANLNVYLGYLYGYHTKLLNNDNESAALKVIDAIVAIISKFTLVNKNSIPPIPPSFPALQSATTMAEGFFSTNYERLIEKTKLYMNRNDGTGIQKMATKFSEMADRLAELEFPILDPRLHNNPELERSVHWLSQVTDEIIKGKNSDAPFYFVRTFGRYAELAITHNQNTVLFSAYRNLIKLATYSAVNQYDVVFVNLGDVYGGIARRILEATFHSQNVKEYLDNLSTIIRWFLIITNDSSVNSPEPFIAPYRAFAEKIIGEVPQASNPTNQTRYDDQRHILGIAEEIRSNIRDLANNTPLINRIIVLSFTDVLEFLITQLLLNVNKQTWNQSQVQLTRTISSLVSVYGWLHHDEKDIKTNYVDSATNSLGRSGLSALQNGQTEIVNNAIDNLEIITNALLKQQPTSDSLRDASEVMTLVGQLTVAALALGNYNVANYGREKILNFERTFIRKLYPNGMSGVTSNTIIGFMRPGQVIRNIKNTPSTLRSRQGLSISLSHRDLDQLVNRLPEVNDDFYLACVKFIKH